ncbi:hypothetical protein CYMTET_20031 [Cymbomonas tetramitiformis]|uniref:Uncharacterized protein n=1 Tax=Cymbomonas tetramitiformis TaxID=36881 RepID=A0AAE0G4W2_9CHLO|nr:hypothetical protein CYMTET_20031 [Cymbomonas tetramitiformis]
MELAAKQSESVIEETKREVAHRTELLEKSERQITELESNVENSVEEDVGLMPWATYRHIVECTWASQLSFGLSTLSVPPGSTITLSSKEIYDGQVVNIPGGATLIAPSGVFHKMTVPSHSIIQFPGDQDSVVFPGATSVILPVTGPDVYTIMVPPRTRIAPPTEEHADPPASSSHLDKLFFAPLGANSTLTCVKGSIIITPKEARVKLTLPSKCEVIFSLGQRRFIEVPGDTNVQTPSGSDHYALLPANARIVLPLQGLPSGGSASAKRVGMEDTSMELYLTLPPQATVRLPGAGGPFDVTLSSGQAVEVPEGCEGTRDIGALPNSPLHQRHVPHTSASSSSTGIPRLTRSEDPSSVKRAVLAQMLQNLLRGRPAWPRSGIPGMLEAWRGCKVCNQNGIPYTLTCPSGALVTTAESLNDDPSAIAERMMMSGTDCASVAIGGMDPKVAAAVMNSGIIDARRVAKILHHSREQAAYQVLRRLAPAFQKQVLECLPGAILGSILSQATVSDRMELLEQANIRGSKSVLIAAQALKLSNVKKLLTQPNFRPWKSTKEVGTLDTLTASRLLATTTSSRAAAILSNMSSSDFAKSVDHMQALHELADRMLVLGLSTKEHDICMYRNLQTLAAVKTEQQLIRACLCHFKHCKLAFGICLTLSTKSEGQEGHGGDDKAEAEKSPFMTQISRKRDSIAPKPNRRRASSRGSIVPNRTIDLHDAVDGIESLETDGLEPDLAFAEIGEELEEEEDENADPSDANNIAEMVVVDDYNDAAGREQLADESLDVPMSTEDIHIGSQESYSGHSLQVGMTVHMTASKLIEVQNKAAAKKGLVIKGTTMMMPVMGMHETEGEVIAFVSHILKRTASDFLLGGFPKPRQNNVPKAIEVLQLTAAALRFAYSNVNTNEAAGPPPEITLKGTAGSNDGEDIEDRIAEYGRLRKKGVNEMLGKKVAVNDTLKKLKANARPSKSVVRIFAAIFVFIELQSLEEYLTPKLDSFPKDPFKAPEGSSKNMSLWEYIRVNLQFSARHPQHLLNMLSQAMKASHSGPVPLEKQNRVQAVNALLQNVELKAVENAGEVVGLLHQWIQLSVKQARMEILLDGQHKKDRRRSYVHKALYMLAHGDAGGIDDPVLDDCAD